MRAKSIICEHNLLSALLFCLASTTSLGAWAQATNQAIYLPPQQSSQGAAPPPGDGATSAPVTPGDSQSEDVPSGRTTSSPEYGTTDPPFQHVPGKIRSRIILEMKEQDGNTRKVLTFEPDQLTDQQRTKVKGIIGAGAVDPNQPYQNITVSKDQLVEMQQALAPSPDLTAGDSAVKMPDGRDRKQIFTDQSALSERKGTNGITISSKQEGGRKVIQEFCRYLVILGVVCSCIFMAFATFAMQQGGRGAGTRVIGTAAGLILLLMAYSIWKVVRYNMDEARGPLLVNHFGPKPIDLVPPPEQEPTREETSPADIKAIKADTSFETNTKANLPVVPAPSSDIGRSGLLVAPLAASH